MQNLSSSGGITFLKKVDLLQFTLKKGLSESPFYFWTQFLVFISAKWRTLYRREADRIPCRLSVVVHGYNQH